MTVTAHFDYRLDVDETFDTGLDLPADPTFVHKVTSPNAVDRGTLTASTDVPATKTYSDTLVLAGGTQTIDLVALAGPGSTTVDCTGLKVQLFKLTSRKSNTNPVLIQKGGSNPYNVLGEDVSSGETLEVMPGGCVALYCHDGLEDVSAAKRNITITGDVNAIVDVQVVAG
jgi:hypothetical protein